MADIPATTNVETVPSAASSTDDEVTEEISRISALVQILHRKTQQEKSDAYAEVVEILFRKSGKLEILSYMNENVVPISLTDISTMKVDKEVDDVLEFLGIFLQAYELKTGEANHIIETLTEKIIKTTSKLESNKAMWCLAGVQYHADTPFEELEKILKSSLLYLSEAPPISSMGTTYEAINVLNHLSTRSPKFLESKLGDILKLTFPMLFHESSKMRELVYKFLGPISSIIRENKLLDGEYQENYQKKYHLTLLAWISDDSMEGIQVWRFLIDSFGCILHRNHSLLNDLLKAEEFALKSDSVAFRFVALDSWRWLIDCFARDSALLLKPKRLRLIMTPFTLSESKTQHLAKKKIELWWHLLDQFGPNAANAFQDVTLVLLKFCFGTPSAPIGTIDTYPELFNLALSSLIGILSSQKVDLQGKLEPSYPLINMIDFIKHGPELNNICVRVFMSQTEENLPLMKSLFEAFVQRCCQAEPHTDWEAILTEQLSKLLCVLMEFPSKKSSTSDFILDCFLRWMDKKVFLQAFIKNLTVYLKWPIQHENKFLAVPYNKVIEQLYQSATSDSTCVMGFVNRIAIALEDVKNNARSLVFRLHAATLWSGFVQLLLNKVDHVKLLYMDLTLFFFPMSIVMDMRTRCENVWVTWMKYFHLMLKNDPLFLDKLYAKMTGTYLHRNNEVTLVATILKFVIRTVFLYGLESLKPKLMQMIKNWTFSWIRYHNHLNKSEPPATGMKSYKILGDMVISFLKDAPEKAQGGLVDCVFNILEVEHPASVIAVIKSEVKLYVLVEANLSCDHFFVGSSLEYKSKATTGNNEGNIHSVPMEEEDDTIEWSALEMEDSVELEEINELDDFIDLDDVFMSSVRPPSQRTIPCPIQIKREVVSPDGCNESQSTQVQSTQVQSTQVQSTESQSPAKSVSHSKRRISTSPQRTASSSKLKARTDGRDKDFEPPKKVECLDYVRRSSRPPKPAPWRLELNKKSPLAITVKTWRKDQLSDE